MAIKMVCNKETTPVGFDRDNLGYEIFMRRNITGKKFTDHVPGKKVTIVHNIKFKIAGKSIA
ncbi:hypothetical protein HA45_12960 [Pantoea rodasii]|nr:hypothetical protein HA45_12960 [Pantoea rodasii]